MTTFDPNAAALPGSGIFGLPHVRDEASVVIVPAPFDATTSYGGGASEGPGAVLRASAQVDLYDAQFGRTYEAGIHMLDEPLEIRELSRRARALAEPLIAKGGADAGDGEALRMIEQAGEQVNAYTYENFWHVLADGKVPGLLGGDHSTPLGAIRACAEYVASRWRPGDRASAKGLGILHVDAHLDLRPAYEGFRYSHASIMYNVLETIPEVSRIVQVGIRDYSEGESEYARACGDRCRTHLDFQWAQAMMDGRRFTDLCHQAASELPDNVYVSFDIDGLDPSLCPHTGTPVPGGLSFNQAALLLQTLRDARKTIVGFDLVEVCPDPHPGAPEWDANVGARVLYKLCGLAAAGR
ncbi:MAG: agmatinase family protein [Phycisphaerae bacterium]|nr:agmatinase family protein [Phycisphaerae bacterium]